MTDVQIQELIKAAKGIMGQQQPFNWIQFMYSATSGIVAAGFITWLTLIHASCKEKRHFRNLVSLILYDLRLNFSLITEVGARNPDNPMILHVETWDMVKLEVSKRLPINLVMNLQGTYHLLYFINGKTYREHDQVQQTTNDKDIIYLIEACIMGLLELSIISKKDKDLFAKDFQTYRMKTQIWPSYLKIDK